MAENKKNEHAEISDQQAEQQTISDRSEEIESLKNSLSESNDKYVRLYAEFENYKKFAARSKEEQLKYANENLVKDLLTVIDHLELALQHSSNNEISNSLAEGVGLTLKELKTVLEKYGLTGIEALGIPFDPSVHHAIAQLETEDTENNIVVKEFRKGYMFKDRVLRAALVGVSKKPSSGSGEQEQSFASEEN
jgi:molecular chaperone GrpE